MERDMVSSIKTAVAVLSAVSAFAIGATGASSTVNAQGWVAIAADGKGSWGYATGKQTQDQARDLALQICGRTGIGCNIEQAAQAHCFAYVESRAGGYWYGVSVGPTVGNVVDSARTYCQLGAPQGSCRVVKASCE
jgi:hypothetical protein